MQSPKWHCAKMYPSKQELQQNLLSARPFQRAYPIGQHCLRKHSKIRIFQVLYVGDREFSKNVFYLLWDCSYPCLENMNTSRQSKRVPDKVHAQFPPTFETFLLKCFIENLNFIRINYLIIMISKSLLAKES